MSEGYVSPWWQAILLPDKWDICGIEIFTLSVWHIYALENLNNLYLGERIRDRDAAANLLILCQRDFAGGRELYLNARIRAKALAKIHKLILPLKFDELDHACTDYIRSCTRVPEHKQPSGDGSYRLISAPFFRRIVLCLCDHYNMAPEQAWNCHYAEARCRYDVLQEEKGDDTLLMEDQMERKEKFQESQK